MPTYAYACSQCSHRFDIYQSFTEDALTTCPECSEQSLRKVFSSVGVVFKGSGFYRNDSRSTETSTSAATKGESKSESKSESSSSSETKPAAKSGEKSGSSAAPAKAAGLIYEVVAEDELEQATLAAARRIADLPPEAMRLTRDLMVGPRDELVARVEEEGRTFRRRLTSDEARNAFLAFMNRKKG